MNNMLAVDLGFVQTKAVDDTGRQEKFRSIAKKRSKTVIDMEDSEGFLIVHDGVAWNVGQKGSYDFTANRLTKDSYLPKLLAVLGLYHEQSGNTLIHTCVSGLPVMEFNNYRDSFAKSLEKSFMFTFGYKKSVFMTIKKALVIPQSAGAYFSYILDNDGMPKNEALSSETVLVLDIGGRTTDGCIMEESYYSQDSFTIFKGVWQVHNELRKLISREFNFTLQPHEVDTVLRSGKIKLGSTEHGVRRLINIAIETIFPVLQDELTLHIDDFRRFSAVLLAGGGAHVFMELFKDFIPVPCICIPDAEFANAKGYLKYAQLMSHC